MSTLRVTILALWICSLHLMLRGMGIDDLYGSALVVAALPAARRTNAGWPLALALLSGVVLWHLGDNPADVVTTLGLLCTGLVTVEVVRRSPSGTVGDPVESESPIDVAEREMRRSRRHGRPLSVVVFRGTERELTDGERTALAGAIAERTNGADLVLPHEQSVVLLLPETPASGAASVVERLLPELTPWDQRTLRTGVAAFPEEEVTLSGLLNRATARAHGEEPGRSEEEKTPTVAETQDVTARELTHS